MSEVLIRELNTTDENDLKMYEEAMYKAFFYDRRVDEDTDCIFDHRKKRCIFKIPYTKQYILIAQLGNVLIAGICVNFDTKLMQIELYGYTITKNEKICEILHIFNNSGSNGTTIILKFKEFILEKLKNEGFKKIYSTCSERRVRQYESMGFTIEKRSEISNLEHLMSMNI
jgi:hypothetical protein